MHFGSDVAALGTLLTVGALLIGATIKVTQSWAKMADDIGKLSRKLTDHITNEQVLAEKWRHETMARIRHDERRLNAIERIIGLLAGSDHGGRAA